MNSCSYQSYSCRAAAYAVAERERPVLVFQLLAFLTSLRHVPSLQAALEQLPTDSLKRIRETYKAMRVVARSAMAGGAAAAGVAAHQEAAAGQVRNRGGAIW
jgi:hypothetical protein